MMNIWINNLTGDVEIINGLNHYIGMKHITVDMFPEFTYLPFVVGFFMAFGMAVAITGSRKMLAIYLILTVIGGVLAMYDFYQWGYDYGHNLDPEAPIQVPGLSYQPPLFGHKRLLNFDAYSFPDVGGWIVIGAAALAFGIYFVDWYQRRKGKKSAAAKLSLVLPVVLALGMFSSCNAQPEPFAYGKDVCHACKMGIMDPKYGNQVITKKGKVYKFDDVICTVRFLQSAQVEEKDIRSTVVINFEKQNDFLDVHKAYFIVDPDLRSPMGSNAAAFSSQQAAEKFNGNRSGTILTWKDLLLKLK